jgi:hypothetical protein
LSDGERVAILEETAEKLLAVRARSGEGRLRVGFESGRRKRIGAILVTKATRKRGNIGFVKPGRRKWQSLS